MAQIIKIVKYYESNPCLQCPHYHHHPILTFLPFLPFPQNLPQITFLPLPFLPFPQNLPQSPPPQIFHSYGLLILRQHRQDTEFNEYLHKIYNFLYHINGKIDNLVLPYYTYFLVDIDDLNNISDYYNCNFYLDKDVMIDT